MITRNDIVCEARQWIGTKWQHQQALKGVACDCIGLIRGVATKVGLLPPDFARSAVAQQFMGYGRRPDGRLVVALDLFMDRLAPTEQPAIGDVLLMRFDDNPQHVAIVTEVGIIHAHASARKVVEHRLDSLWASRVVQAYRFKGLD